MLSISAIIKGFSVLIVVYIILRSPTKIRIKPIMTIRAMMPNAARKLVLRIAKLMSEGAITLAIELDEL